MSDSFSSQVACTSVSAASTSRAAGCFPASLGPRGCPGPRGPRGPPPPLSDAVNSEARDVGASSLAVKTACDLAAAALETAVAAGKTAYPDLHGELQRRGLVAERRIQLAGPLALYIRTDGSDVNTGLADTPGEALASFTGVRRIMRELDMRGHRLTVAFGPGTHAAGAQLTSEDGCGAGSVLLTSANAALPARIETSGAYAVEVAQYPCRVIVEDLRLRAVSACLRVSNSAVSLQGRCSVEGDRDGCYAVSRSSLTLETGCVLTVSGSGRYGLVASEGSSILGSHATLHFDDAVFSSSALFCSRNSLIALPATVTGTATGQRFYVSVNSCIYSDQRGQDLVPGSEAGGVHGSTFGCYY